MKTKHIVKDFICDYEGKHFNSKDKLRLHIYKHRKHFLVCCTVCGNSYTTRQSMRKHLRTHIESHQCAICGQVYKYKRLLQNHIARVHDDTEPSVSCRCKLIISPCLGFLLTWFLSLDCTRLFNNYSQRDGHEREIHKDQKVNTASFKCSDCPLGFEMREELRIHSFIHYEGEIHTCLECHQIFKKKALLNFHMQKHEGQRFQCSACKQLFKYRSNLSKHNSTGRCKGPPKEMIEPEQLAEEVAVIAKQQLIDMTADPARTFKRHPLDNLENVDNVEEEELVESSSEDLNNEFYDEKLSRKLRSKKTFRRKNPVLSTHLPKYECDLCDFNAPKKCEMLSHIRQHIARNRHRCKRCQETFKTKTELHSHSMKKHGRGAIGSTEYSKSSSQCPFCDRVFSDSRMKYHLKLHERPIYICDHCGNTFNSLKSFERHFPVHIERRFVCTTCGKCFKTKTVLDNHEKSHNPRIYVNCEICSTKIQTKNLKLHMEIIHGDRYKEKNQVCGCGKAFRYEKQLEAHRKAVHEKVDRGVTYNCPECDLSFTRQSELREHSLDHFTGTISNCSECGKRFKTQKLLNHHFKVHVNERAHFACEMCKSMFVTRGGLRKHLAKVHGPETSERVKDSFLGSFNWNW